MENKGGLNDDLKTLSSCINMVEKSGFTVQFKATSIGLKSLVSNNIFSPSQINIVNFYRFEGASDPDDNAILYALETFNGEKGTLVDAYGAYSD